MSTVSTVSTISNIVILTDEINSKIIFTINPITNYLCVLNKYNTNTNSSRKLDKTMQTYLISSSTIKQLINSSWIKWCSNTYPLKKMLNMLIKSCKSNRFNKSNISTYSLELIRSFNNIQDNLNLLNSKLFCTINNIYSVHPVHPENPENLYNFFKNLDTNYNNSNNATNNSTTLNIFLQLNNGFKIDNIQYSPFVFHMILLYICDNSNIIFNSLKDLLNLKDISLLDNKTILFKWEYRIIPICTIPLDMGYFIVVAWDIDRNKYYAFLLGGSNWNDALYNYSKMQIYIKNINTDTYTDTDTKHINTQKALFNTKLKINDTNIIEIIQKLKKLEQHQFSQLMNVD